MLAVMAGYDASDPTSSTVPLVTPLGGPPADLVGVRVGVDRSLIERYAVDAGLADCFDAAIAALAATGATMVDVAIPHYEALTTSTMSGWPAEALANHRADLQARWSDYGRPTRQVIAAGALMNGADFVQAQRVRRVGMEAMASLFATCDVVVTPTAGVGALLLDGIDFASVIASVFTPVWNAVGFPALSVPMGFTGAGLPLGLQIAARPFEDATALDVGMAFQTQTEWHRCQPDVAVPAAV
jgi:aspartyl-tRNA(Asn)/glutamyl-tRNA(Gln) amidotransferase subunit A